MNTLKIWAQRPQNVTILQNDFIDRLMPRANGEFVKVYLYILRCSASGLPLTLSDVADHLRCTEQDVVRALKYWEEEGLLMVSFSPSGVPEEIDLAPGEGPAKEASAPPAAEAESVPEDDEEEIRALVLAIEQYMNVPLSASDLQRLLYFHDTLHFSTDLLEYLIEYCVDSGHRSIRYIEKVGSAWYERGIRTVEEARKEQRARKEYYTILASLGISGRAPVEAETVFMDKWLNDYGFSMDIIEEACSRTILNTKQPSLKYADGILTRWHEAGVRTRSDIGVLDSAHEERKKTNARRAAAPSGNRFGAFEQHDYDFDAIEKELIRLQQ